MSLLSELGLKKLVTARRQYLHIYCTRETEFRHLHLHDSRLSWLVARVLLCRVFQCIVKEAGYSKKTVSTHTSTGETEFIIFHKSVLKSQP